MHQYVQTNIEPNMEKEAFLFDDTQVISQLRYSGMLDTIRIRKAGFSFRIPFDIFVKEYKCLLPVGSEAKSAEANTFAVMQDTKVSTELWQCGRTKIFLKDEGVSFSITMQLEILQKQANNILKVKVLIIQKTLHGFVYRKRFLQILKSLRLLYKYLKGFVYRKRFIKKRAATIKIQSGTVIFYLKLYVVYTQEITIANLRKLTL